MTWEIKVIKGKRHLFYENRKVSQTLASQILGISYYLFQRVYSQYRTTEKFNARVEDIQWLQDRGYSNREKVFTREGKRSCISKVAEISGAARNTSRARLQKWVKKEITTDRLYERIEVTRERMNKIAVANMLAANKCHTNWGDLGLGPRTSVDDLPELGSWEKEQPKDAVFVKAGSGHFTGKKTNSFPSFRGD